ncbi:MAG TPA: phosphonate C-P lyase system protein PhnH [Devosia sp.]|nr:phosphonate C-P lyase system protein PhnH [Devosia sp.]
MALALSPTRQETLTNATFEALLWSLSRPGEIRNLPVAGIEMVAESLCDREVSLFCFDEALAARLKRTGVRPAPLEEADYVLADGGIGAARAARLAVVNPGTMIYPEASATVIAGGRIGQGTTLRLSGPGIAGATTIAVGDIDPAFWAVRNEACRYPLGWDVFVVDGDRVVGLPRSTKLEVL